MRQFTGQEIGKLVNILPNYFDRNAFEMVLDFRLNKKLEQLSGQNNLTYQIYEVITKANQDGWQWDLLAALRAEKPKADELRSFAIEIGILAGNFYQEQADNILSSGQLEAFVKGVNLVKWADFTSRLQQIERCVGSIKVSGQKTELGTGFLVGPDLFLTNYHVVKELVQSPATISTIRIRFDYKTAGTGKEITLTNEPTSIIAHRKPADLDTELQALTGTWPADSLDYALVQLNEPIGGQPFGPQTGAPLFNAPLRGWITAPAVERAMQVGRNVIIAQHPNGNPLQQGLGEVLGTDRNRLRVRYNTNTDNGSSGSPCFNEKLEWVALHHLGNWSGEYNQGIPTGRIIADLNSQGIQLPQLPEATT